MSGADVFRSYLERFTAGDVDGAAELLTEEFTFEGPVNSSPLVPGYRSHRTAERSSSGWRALSPTGAEWAALLDEVSA